MRACVNLHIKYDKHTNECDPALTRSTVCCKLSESVYFLYTAQLLKKHLLLLSFVTN